jgi:ATP-dependent helicase YprA (DUF1998 family)
MIKRFFQKRRQKLIDDIAKAVINKIDDAHLSGEFLPPVTLNGMVYIMTKRGEIYRMQQDLTQEMEIIMQIRR